MATLQPRRYLKAAHVSLVIDKFYEAALRPVLWRDTLHAFSEAVGAEGSLLLIPGPAPEGRFACSEGLDASMPDYLAGNWHLSNDVIRRGLSAARSGSVVQTEWTLFGADEYRRDLFFNEFLRPHGFGWFAGFFLNQSPGTMITLSPQRRLHDDPFTPDEADILAMLVPHLRRAGEFATALSGARADGALDTLALLDIPAFLLDRAGRVRHRNAGADALLGRGLPIQDRRLTSPFAGATAALQNLARTLTDAPPSLGLEPPPPVRQSARLQRQVHS